MLKLFEGVKDYIKIQTSTDSWIVRLHQSTAFLLLIFSVLITGKQYFGDPINCMQEHDERKEFQKLINNYCFIMTTYTVPEQNLKGCNSDSYAHPGVKTVSPDEPVTHHAYYQWVPIVLILQMLSFTLPHFFWNQCEGGLINNLLNSKTDIDLQREILEEENKEKERQEKEKKEEQKEEEEKTFKPKEEEKKFKPRMQLIAEYFVKTIKTHQFLAFGWFGSDCLALMIAILNFYLTNQFLGGSFSNYGLEVYDYFLNTPTDPQGCFSPVDRIFPKVTKCLFHKFGPSGSIQTIDAMCIMALNILNEKLYVILWFWFFFLILLTLLGIIGKLTVLMVLTCVSKSQMRAAPKIALKFFGTPPYAAPTDLRFLAQNLVVSDWIFFSLLVKNMTPYMYKQFADYLTNEKKSVDGVSFFQK